MNVLEVVQKQTWQRKFVCFYKIQIAFSGQNLDAYFQSVLVNTSMLQNTICLAW